MSLTWKETIRFVLVENLLIIAVTYGLAGGARWPRSCPAAPQTAQPMSICATTQRGSVRSMMISHALLSTPLSMKRVGELRLVVVEVRRAEAGLDRALAEPVEQLRALASVAA